VIARDPALSAKILRTVNSSFYGRSQAIGTVSQALVILGLQSVKTLVLGFSLAANLGPGGQGGRGKGARRQGRRRRAGRGFGHVAYWKHSIYAATAARTIAHRLQIVQQEEAFLAPC
jgi:HD-like signal output (HDOD) protein